jgi:hypothetical protein
MQRDGARSPRSAALRLFGSAAIGVFRMRCATAFRMKNLATRKVLVRRARSRYGFGSSRAYRRIVPADIETELC